MVNLHCGDCGDTWAMEYPPERVLTRLERLERTVSKEESGVRNCAACLHTIDRFWWTGSCESCVGGSWSHPAGWVSAREELDREREREEKRKALRLEAYKQELEKLYARSLRTAERCRQELLSFGIVPETEDPERGRR